MLPPRGQNHALQLYAAPEYDFLTNPPHNVVLSWDEGYEKLMLPADE